MKVGVKVGKFKEMLTTGACIDKREYYRLTKRDSQKFINHKDYIIPTFRGMLSLSL